MKILLLLSLILSGCGYSFFAAKTLATYEADGKKITYQSDKEQQGLVVKYILDADGKTKEIHLRVDKAGAQDEATTGAVQQSQAMSALMQSLMPLILKAAAMGGGS